MSIGNLHNLKIALAHDWLLGVGGAEKTLKTLHEIFPQAPIYTLFHNKLFTDEFLPQAEIRPSRLQKTYNLLGSHKLLTPFLPMTIESFDLSGFDLVVSSSVAFSKGLILKPQTRHICYCYSPTRQLWDWHAEYLQESNSFFRVSFFKFCVFAVQHLLRIWDRHASTRVDRFIAISENVRRRIKKYYNRNSVVIYPPVNLPADRLASLQAESYFLIVSRLYKHKNIDIAIKAFNKLGWPLVIIGDGPELKRLKKMARSINLGQIGSNIKFLGYQPDAIVHSHYANCSAFIMPQEEDFGITPVEAMSYGKPVLALARGGALEYIEEGINGEFFEDPTEEVLADGVRRLVENLSIYDPLKIKKSAEKFTTERFKKEIFEFACLSQKFS